jgi:hypothetical protein
MLESWRVTAAVNPQAGVKERFLATNHVLSGVASRDGMEIETRMRKKNNVHGEKNSCSGKKRWVNHSEAAIHRYRFGACSSFRAKPADRDGHYFPDTYEIVRQLPYFFS